MSSSPVIRAGLRHLIRQQPDVLRLVNLRPGQQFDGDVIVFDLDGYENDVQAANHVRAQEAAVLGIAPVGRPDLLDYGDFIGLAGVITTTVDAASLTQALLKAASGPALTSTDWPSKREVLLRVTTLTPREADVLELIGAGYGNTDISRSLYLSINSVKTYVRQAYKKIGVTSRPQAVLWTVRHGLISVNEPPSRTRTGAMQSRDERGHTAHIDSDGGS